MRRLRLVAGVVCLSVGFVLGLLVPRAERAPAPDDTPHASTARESRKPRTEPSAQSEPDVIAIRLDEPFDMAALYRDLQGKWRGSLTVRVVGEETREPVLDALQVKLQPIPSSTDEQALQATRTSSGNVTFSDVPYPAPYRIAVISDDERLSGELRLAIGVAQKTVTVRVRSVGRVRGMITSSAPGGPIAGARVIVGLRLPDDPYTGLEYEEARSDAAGEYVIEFDPRLLPATVAAIAPGWSAEETAATRVSSVAYQASLVLRPGAQVVGRVFSSEELPEVRVRVLAIRSTTADGYSHSKELLQALGLSLIRWGKTAATTHQEYVGSSCRPSSDGSFRCSTVLPADDILVIVQARGFRAVVRRLGRPVLNDEREVVVDDIELPKPGPGLSARLVSSADGSPLAGVQVRVQSLALPWAAQLNSSKITTNERGEFTTDFVAPGTLCNLFLRGGPQRVRHNLESVTLNDGTVFEIPRKE